MRTPIPGIDDFDVEGASGPERRRRLELLTRRLGGLHQRREDLGEFRVHLQLNRRYLNVAVETDIDIDTKRPYIKRQFCIPFESDEAFEQITALTDSAELALNEEIEFTKELLRKVLVFY